MDPKDKSDMTPQAKVPEMPKTRTTPKANAVTAGAFNRAPAIHEKKGVFPAHITPGGGWLSGLAHEQIHALATHVLAHHTDQGLRTLAFTSALAGEGKTTLSLALSEKLARAGKRILVIDLDTHRATLSGEAGLDGIEGAMESSKEDGATNRLHAYPTDRPGVFIMPVGKLDLSTIGGVPLLDPARVQALVQRALEEFDLVLLDCPPLMPVADTHVIADIADRTVLVVRAHSTPKQIVEQALREFDSGKLFAAILNRAQPQFIPYFREVYGYYRRPSAK
ncbi:MAG TPA: CpsD/CapB family tyrosine-protein kinase [Planctomycetota bacterium]|nr:CpsD/CapB family tyrosine-protein kinase [Planctomycetota bacterium]